MTNFVSAVYFLDNVDAKALTIEPDEFDRAIQRSKHNAKALNEHRYAKYNHYSMNKDNHSGHSLDSHSNRNRNMDITVVSSELDIEKLLAEYKKSVHIVNKKEFIPIKEIYNNRNKPII